MVSILNWISSSDTQWWCASCLLHKAEFFTCMVVTCNFCLLCNIFFPFLVRSLLYISVDDILFFSEMNNALLCCAGNTNLTCDGFMDCTLKFFMTLEHVNIALLSHYAAYEIVATWSICDEEQSVLFYFSLFSICLLFWPL